MSRGAPAWRATLGEVRPVQSERSAEEPLLLQRDGDTAMVVFNRPRARNAITTEMWHTLQRILRDLAGDTSVRAVLFRGAGERALASGAYIGEFGETRSSREGAVTAYHLVTDTMGLIERLPQPTLALIHGYAVGAGCELAIACDLRVAADTARIGIPAARLNITIGQRHIRRLVGLVGPARAKDLLMTARLVEAEEALRIGLVDYVVPPAVVDSFGRDLAQRIAANAPLAVRWAKEVVNRCEDDPGLATAADDAETATQYVLTADFAEGVRAFREKRPPRFTGC
jgi:enoyl-CoA hydratase